MPTFLKDHEKGIKKVLSYIAQHSSEKLTLDVLGKIAGIAPFHFHRLFAAYMGETVGDYVRRVRMEKALGRIGKNEVITDIALDSGYSSSSSFSDAFRKTFQNSPSEVRKSWEAGRQAKFLKKEKLMKPDILEIKEDIPIIFVRKLGNYFESAPAAWNELGNLNTKFRLTNEASRYFSIGHDDPHSTDIAENQIRFDACLSLNKAISSEMKEDGIQSGFLGNGLYACFTHVGAEDTLGKSYHYIYGEWLYKSEFALRDAPTFVELLDFRFGGDFVSPEDRTSKIFLPVRPLEKWHREGRQRE